jgi:GntR family transcriptional repressor for pyruvate dehydrogenase complex
MLRRKLYQELMSDLLGRIMSGEFAPGDKLPRELDVAQRYQVSRNVARECNQALEERGVVRVRHGVGALVAPMDEWNLFDLELLEALLAGPAGRDTLAEALECRMLLEPEAAALAAERRAADDVAALREALSALAEPQADGDAPAALELHGQVLRAAGNRFVRRAIAPLDAVMHVAAVKRRDRERVAADGEQLVEAIAAQDPDAARAAMRRRLEHLRALLRAPRG